MKVAVAGGGAGGAAAVAELLAAGHEVSFWGRSPQTLAPFQEQGGVAYEGVLGTGPRAADADHGRPARRRSTEPMSSSCACPTFAHAGCRARAGARRRQRSGRAQSGPHRRRAGVRAALSRARRPRRRRSRNFPRSPTWHANTRPAASRSPATPRACGLRRCPEAKRPRRPAQALFRSAALMPDVLACDLANVNMVLHAPGAVLGAAWVEATRRRLHLLRRGHDAWRRARHARARR